MGCNKNAICVRVNPWNINSTRTMYAQYYALEFNIILNLTNPIKVCVIWIIYSYDFIIIYVKVLFICFFVFVFVLFFLKFFQQPCFSIFSIWTSMFCFTHWLCLVAMRRKFDNIIQCKDILDPPSHYSVDVPLNDFLSIIMSWSVFKPWCLTYLTRYSLRHDIMHNF